MVVIALQFFQRFELPEAGTLTKMREYRCLLCTGETGKWRCIEIFYYMTVPATTLQCLYSRTSHSEKHCGVRFCLRLNLKWTIGLSLLMPERWTWRRINLFLTLLVKPVLRIVSGIYLLQKYPPQSCVEWVLWEFCSIYICSHPFQRRDAGMIFRFWCGFTVEIGIDVPIASQQAERRCYLTAFSFCGVCISLGAACLVLRHLAFQQWHVWGG